MMVLHVLQAQPAGGHLSVSRAREGGLEGRLIDELDSEVKPGSFREA